MLDGFPKPLTWQVAKTSLYYIPEPSDMDVADSIKAPVAGKIIKVLANFDAKRGELRFIPSRYLSEWKLTQEQVDEAAEHNLTNLVSEHTMRLKNRGRFSMRCSIALRRRLRLRCF